jgi:hypothetical protein
MTREEDLLRPLQHLVSLFLVQFLVNMPLGQRGRMLGRPSRLMRLLYRALQHLAWQIVDQLLWSMLHGQLDRLLDRVYRVRVQPLHQSRLLVSAVMKQLLWSMLHDRRHRQHRACKGRNPRRGFKSQVNNAQAELQWLEILALELLFPLRLEALIMLHQRDLLMKKAVILTLRRLLQRSQEI